MKTYKSIMLPEEVHRDLKLAATLEGLTMTSFTETLFKTHKPVLYDKKFSNCSTAVNVGGGTHFELQIAAIKAGVTMGRYVAGLLESYQRRDILE